MDIKENISEALELHFIGKNVLTKKEYKSIVLEAQENECLYLE